MRDALPRTIRNKESAVVNLDVTSGKGTHWTAYKKNGRIVKYFDSYGKLPPPLELQRYFCGRGRVIYYNDSRYQNVNDWNCGHLCLAFLLS